VLIPATDNPNEKLGLAHDLLGEGRVMQARRQTEEAIAIFQRDNDRSGLAKAYRQYAFVALYGGLNPDPVILYDRKVPLHATPPDLDISDRYLVKARDFAQGTDRYLVAYIDIDLGDNEVSRGKTQDACRYFDLAQKDFVEAVNDKPNVAFFLPKGVTMRRPSDFASWKKREAHCPD